MKRIFALLMAVFMIIGLCACGDSSSSSDSNNSGYNDYFQADADYNITPTSERISVDKISDVGAYSEGLIFISTYEENLLDSNSFCVDKNGYIVYSFPSDVSCGGTQFHNGYAFVSQGEFGSYASAVCDKNWKLTKPSDVGATDFYCSNELLEMGYIIAVKEDSSYSGTTKSLGVLNTDFEWVVPLSTSLYEDIGTLLYSTSYLAFTANGCFYICPRYDNPDKFFNLQTGEVKSGDYASLAPSESWGFYRHDGYYVQSAGDFKKLVDVEDNAEMGAAFKDGVSALLYLNEESDKYYAAMIDEKGNHLFEPVEVDAPNNEAKITVDGDYMAYLSGYTLVTIDRNGNKNSVRLPSDTIGLSTTLNFNDGIITVRVRTSDGYWAGCYDTDLNMLFG